jgi:hypothetical protein
MLSRRRTLGVGVAAGYFVSNAVQFVPVFYVVLRLLGQGGLRFARLVLTPMCLAGVMVLAILGCEALLPLDHLPAVVPLIALILVGASTYGALAFLFARQSLSDVLRFFRRR